ncbi:UDP-galactose-lipid carrier transferase [Bacillus benzoevorans]|uniref:Polyphosphate kinase 2 (PPK2 family) n=1 Tax=Bacillus benzoevorans TaxID=1456 RepID=A0A7X0HP07_9BACI|nr:polyphosphate kinase 2 (PPK2 family) [Bacillus benzoevorans]
MEQGRIGEDFTYTVIEKKEYEKTLKKYQWRLLRLQHVFHQEKMAAIIVMEGVDAAGKGGVIKRITEHLDPRGFRVMAIAAPEPHEKRYHYLQRFWRKIPQYGQMTIFDRSWYGRVLVERIEGFAKEKEWKRAYGEINDFEKILSVDGYLIIKFYFHITMDEQLARFKARQENPFKRWKLTSEDWRNRERWDDYVIAAEEMFAKTDKNYAPWHIIACDDKKYSRIETLKIIVKSMENYLKDQDIPLPDYGEE